ncbi:translational machinery component [Dendrothele bispora CBS 962.96]|uniref:Translational machinery component n=1 Tax=Dendrothele bispora (strain CBS 962.96) TaxID=1314807 RepID=A0A4S8MR97_DENBC|nr:translational machinery component [Dendrothele bispora CBS 962.96]
MLISLRSCRSPLLSIRKQFLSVARYSTESPSQTATYDDGYDSSDLVNELQGDGPPTSGTSIKPPRSSLPGSGSYRLPVYQLHCHSTKNNTIVTFTNPNGNPIAWYSGGSCGFKGGQRSSYEAGYQCSVKVFERIKEVAEKESLHLDLCFKGFGQGRDAMQKALLTSEGEFVRPLVSKVTDRTPIKIGGTRSKKMRRL